ncbi:hypothetical protein V3851_12320 [Paenibacillus sp. M1]|uniref:NERD domain-containing protein n=1 Tax=Paenibacillus haidiansis TaxID=1574488 RepID=A0ABU7VTP1_9BACL
MIFENPEYYNFYKAENELKKGYDNFLKYIEKILKTQGIEMVIRTIKVSGIAVDLYGNQKQKKVFHDVIAHLLLIVENNEKLKINKLVTESLIFEEVIASFYHMRSKYFDENEKLEDKYKIVSYLISLERFLNSLSSNSGISKDYSKKTAMFDSVIESTGMILKNFMFMKYEFSGSNKDIPSEYQDVSTMHFIFSAYWNDINDLLEYWKYSDLYIENKDNKTTFEIKDKEFELNNLISNERFINLREGWQMSSVGEIINSFKESKQLQNEVSKATDNLTYLFATLYFGTATLNKKVENIFLSDWIRAYQILTQESKKFLQYKKRVENNNKIKNVCLSKTKKMWKELYKRNGFTSSEFEIIFELLTFNNKSQDLIDCPLIKVDDQYIVIPSLTAKADPARALASNFLNKNINLDFKGSGFEDRVRAGFNLRKIRNSRLYKKDDETEYECDVAFIIENDIFFVECKAHVQPYTTRQHTNHLYKLYKETLQLNRIADFFSSNISLVKKQLKLDDEFKVRDVHRILITTSMLGTPLYVNGVYIIDESSFTMFIDRTPPSLMLVNNGVFKQQYTENFDIYHGEITVDKIIEFLKSPPQIHFMREFYSDKLIHHKLYDIKRNVKVKKTIYMGDEINNMNQELIEKFYSGQIDI